VFRFRIKGKEGKPMTALSFKVASAFENQYEMIRGKIHELVAPLSTEQIWRRPYP